MERRDERTKLCLTEHLKSRWVNLALHRCWIDNEEQVATFPLYNLSGHMVGFQKYCPSGNKLKRNTEDGRYHTVQTQSKIGVWGLESWNLSNTLFVTEGIFDAARLTNSGLSAIALLANDLSKVHLPWWKIVCSTRPVVMVCDGDQGSKRMRKLGHQSVVLRDGEDVGSLHQDDFGALLSVLHELK